MPRHRSAALFATALIVFAFPAVMPAAAQDPGAHAPVLAGLDEYVEAAMRDWQVPGLALAIVRNDSVLVARGYGTTSVDAGTPVDEHTLFAIASTTKAMTTAALGMLVDEKKLAWDDPVTRHLPWFQLRDPYVSRELTVRDLVTHRSGVARNDQLWIAAPFDRAEVLRRARFLPTTSGFRADYGYHNVMYIAAGEVVGAAAGSSWDDFLEQRLFQPLGMTRSTSRAAVVETRDNVAGSHVRVDGRVHAVPRRNYDNIGGAGAVFSSAFDMAQWLRLQLGAGEYDGRRILDAATVRELHTPHTVIRGDTVGERLFPTTNFRAYGLGWVVQDHHGRKLVHHSGSINYTRTQVGMVPSEGIGVVVMANLNSSNLQLALMHHVLDELLGLPHRDWSAEYLELARRTDERALAERHEVDAARTAGTRPSVELDAYAGNYRSELYGDMRLSREDDRIVLHYAPDYVADLEHWHHDTFRAVWRRTGSGRAFITFALDARGRVAVMSVEGFGEFRRTAE